MRRPGHQQKVVAIPQLIIPGVVSQRDKAVTGMDVSKSRNVRIVRQLEGESCGLGHDTQLRNSSIDTKERTQSVRSNARSLIESVAEIVHVSNTVTEMSETAASGEHPQTSVREALARANLKSARLFANETGDRAIAEHHIALRDDSAHFFTLTEYD